MPSNMPSVKSPRIGLITFFVAIVFGAGLSACSKTQTSEALVAEARQYQQKGDFKAAIIQLKNALQKDSKNGEARFMLGTLYLQVGEPQSAEKELRSAASLGIAQDKVRPELAKALLMMGKFQAVIDETQQFTSEKADGGILTARGNAYLALGKNPQAKESFDLALKRQADSPEALIGLARLAMIEKDEATATRLIEQSIAKNPKSMESWLFKGSLLRSQGKLEPALAAYDETLKLKPDNSEALLLKAHVEIGAQKFNEAKLNIDAAKKVTPNNLAVLYTQALLDFRENKHAAALDSLQQILRVAPDHMPSLLLAGTVQYSLGATQQAEQHLKKYLDKNADDLYARKVLTAALLKNGQTQRAITTLAPALHDAQDDVQVYMLAGDVYMQAKDFTKATEYLNKANALEPKTAKVHTALAMSKLGQGQHAPAIAELELAASLDTKSPQAGILLVMTHMRMKEFDKALAASKTLEKEQPDNPLVQNLKGGAYLGKKDMAGARASFEKAIALQDNFYPAVVNLAHLDIFEKKPDIAKKRFESLIEKDKKNFRAMISLAGIATTSGRNDEAKIWLERASNENPDAIEPAKALVTHYFRAGEKQKAVTLAAKLQSSNSGNPDFLTLLAQTQFTNGEMAASLDSYNKLAVLSPTSASAQSRIASVHVAMQNDTAALASLKKALNLDPNHLESMVMLGAIELRKGNVDNALAISRQIQKQHEKSAAGFAMEADVLMSQKKPELAIKLYERAIALNKSGLIVIKLHEALAQTGKGKDADARLSAWIKEHPADSAARTYAAQLALANKNYKVAIEHLLEIVKAEPTNAGVLNNLAWALDQEKDPRALEYAEKAFQIAGESPSVMDTLGWMLVEKGDLARGLPMLKKAAGLAPDAAEIRFHFAKGLVKSGDKQNARKELEHLLTNGKNFSSGDEAKSLLNQL